MTSRLLCTVFGLVLSLPLVAEEEAFQPLFNGRDLTGWVPVNTAPSTWSVNEEGYLVCTGKPIGELRTEKMYQNFILEIEWRHLVPGGNAGIFVWADDITARGVPFHRGIEVQVLENAYGNTESHTTHGDIFPIHGASMTPENGRGGSRAFPTENRSKPSPEWNHYRVECRDGAISLAVNGKVVTRGRDCRPRKGYLCLESEGGVVHYRNARIQELPDTPIAPEDVAQEARGYRTLYTGVDFSGWKTKEPLAWRTNDWVFQNEEGAPELLTQERFGEGTGFLFDLRQGEGEAAPEIWLGEQRLLQVGAAGELLRGAGEWDRFEGVIQDGRVRWTVNGREGPTTDLEGIGEGGEPLALKPGGKADWANLFVRDVSSGERPDGRD